MLRDDEGGEAQYFTFCGFTSSWLCLACLISAEKVLDTFGKYNYLFGV